MIEQINRAIAAMEREGEDPAQLRLSLLAVITSNLSVAYNEDQTMWHTYQTLPPQVVGLLGDLEEFLVPLESMSGDALLAICVQLIQEVRADCRRVS